MNKWNPQRVKEIHKCLCGICVLSDFSVMLNLFVESYPCIYYRTNRNPNLVPVGDRFGFLVIYTET